MSATRPATEFSIGIMAWRFPALHGSQCILEGGAPGSRSGYTSRQAKCELAPARPDRTRAIPSGAAARLDLAEATGDLSFRSAMRCEGEMPARLCQHLGRPRPVMMRQARSRSSGVFGLDRHTVNERHVDTHAASSAAAAPAARASSVEGRSDTNRSSAERR